ncbi:MAG TPA: sigma-70 family RNA polymerase sigma factor [Pyrinomonadaceae bacterium]|nr:sigma-70 family RNA polymerase sigma factor [Pyrinomonadaceae bacterium]
MFRSLLKRMLPLTAAKDDHGTSSASAHVDYGRLVKRIIDGDAEAEAELVDLFEDAVLHIIRRIAKNSPLVEDFSQDTFLTVIRKIRNGDVKQPESLGSFIANTARFHTLEQLRRIRQRARSEDLEHAEEVPDPSPTQLDQLQTSEQFDELRDLVRQLTPRYRELLFRFYINEEPKEMICADLGLKSGQFDRVLHRARKRCRALYLERKRAREKGGS